MYGPLSVVSPVIVAAALTLFGLKKGQSDSSRTWFGGKNFVFVPKKNKSGPRVLVRGLASVDGTRPLVQHLVYGDSIVRSFLLPEGFVLLPQSIDSGKMDVVFAVASPPKYSSQRGSFLPIPSAAFVKGTNFLRFGWTMK